MKNFHVDGYVGYSDFDGPSDYNYHKDFIMDDSVSIHELENLLHYRFQKYRCKTFHVIELIELVK